MGASVVPKGFLIGFEVQCMLEGSNESKFLDQLEAADFGFSARCLHISAANQPLMARVSERTTCRSSSNRLTHVAAMMQDPF